MTVQPLQASLCRTLSLKLVETTGYYSVFIYRMLPLKNAVNIAIEPGIGLAAPRGNEVPL